MLLRFLRCFALFRELESDLSEARTEVAIGRDRADRADRECSRLQEQYDKAYDGQVEALKMLANVSVQVHIGCAPPHPDVWHLPQRKPKQVEYDPIPTGRVNPNDVLSKARDQFVEDIAEYFQKQAQ